MTIKQIAKKASVSIATVDRVLHKRGRVSKETREKIQAIISQSGYKKNIFASNLKLQKTFNLAVLMPQPEQESKYWDSSKKGIMKALSELSIYKLKSDFFFFDRFSDISFSVVINEIFKKKYDGIILAPVIDNLAMDFVKKLPQDMPYVFFNTNIPGTQPLCFIGQDSYGCGRVAAKLMKGIISERGVIAIIQASEDEFHHAQRTKGFISFFQGDDNFDIRIFRLHGDTEKDSFISLMDEITSSCPTLLGIFVTSSSCHYAAEYLDDTENKNKVRIIGYDLVEENICYLEKGRIDFLISQKPEEQGYQAVYSMFRKLVLHEIPENEVIMPVDIIIRENLKYYTTLT